MDRQLVKKFFNNTCSPGEAEKVLEWLETEEGQQFLLENLEQDIDLVQNERIKPLLHDIRSEKMWNEINSSANSNLSDRIGQRNKTSFWHVAAAVFLLLTSSIFYYWNHKQIDHTNPPEIVTYTTVEDQHKKLILTDGTKIRLNENSKIEIPDVFGQSEREISLIGEAYFEVIHDDEMPLIIHTPDATVKDLGTAFNVKAISDEQNVQVAVTEGRVLLWSNKQSDKQAVELTKGEYAYLNLSKNLIEIDDLEVKNYLSWINGRLTFDRAPLKQVSDQLSRLYGVTFEFSSDSLMNLKLTSDFEKGSLNKVLEVISLTLNLNYRLEKDTVHWLPAKDKLKGNSPQEGQLRLHQRSIEKELGR